MEIHEALELKDKFLNSYTSQNAYPEQGFSPDAIVESFFQAKPADRLAIGVSALGMKVEGSIPGNFRLELRVQRTDGPAFREAKRIIDQVHGEGRILVLRRLELPTYSSLIEGLSRLFRVPPKGTPLRIGDPVRCRRAGPGTLGGFVLGPKGPGFLSSSHVLAAHASAAEKPRKTDPIWRPPPALYSLMGGHEVGELLEWNEFDRAAPNYVDAAFAQITNDHIYDGNVVPKFDDIPRRLHGRDLTALPAASREDIVRQFQEENYWLLGRPVAKIGSATGYTEGYISGALIDGITAFVPWLGKVTYVNVIEITPNEATLFTQAGDSGSTVFLIDDCIAFGLHFGSGEAYDERMKPLGYKVSYACSIQTIQYEFDQYTWL